MATIWANEMIEADILEVSRHIGNNLMPTRTDIHDFYDFTVDSFRLEGYEYSPFDRKIPVAE